MKKPELLAPAGSFEKAKTAFMYGADAIYCGTSSLSLRTRAEMDDSDLVKTIEYAHKLGKRVHVAINIFAWDESYEEIKKQAKILNDLKVDGIIVADGGVVDIVKEVAPDVDIHISTQANTVSLHSANFWYKNGAKRIILARELNKEQIRYMIENKPKDLEIEMYIFSSKDLCLIKEIPEIIEMELDSLKIEGRLKTEYYLATVINAYRTAIDDYFENPEQYDYKKYLNEIEKVKTRSLTTFYFNDRNNRDFQEYEGKQYNPNFEYGGKLLEYNNEKSIVEIKNKLKVGDFLEVIIPGEIESKEFEIKQMWDSETEEAIESVNPGRAGQTVKINIPFNCENGWIIRRKK